MADNIFEEIKKRVDLVEIVKEDFPLSGKGHQYRGDREDISSLVVVRSRKSGEWYYYWNSRGEGGDVFNWLKNQRGMDMKSALEFAAKKAGVTVPEWTHRDTRSWMRAKATEDLLSVATRVFQRWMKSNGAAMDYARGRGWTDATIESARIGFSGFATAAEFKEMRETLTMNNIDPESPAAVAILGFKGDVSKLADKWGRDHDLTEALDNKDVENGYVPGFMGRPRLIYPHLYFQKVTYMSSRNLVKTEDGKLIGEPDKKKKSFNPRVELAGQRQPYFGWNYRADSKDVVIVEGPADVITLAQYGFNTFGQIGTYLDEYWAKELRERHTSIYHATDSDGAGRAAVIGKNRDFPIADQLTPLTQIVTWAGKDVNDMRQWCVRRKIGDEKQVEMIQRRLSSSPTVAELAAREAALRQQDKRLSVEEKNEAMMRAYDIVARIKRDKKLSSELISVFLRAFGGITTSTFNKNLKLALGERGEDVNDDSKPMDSKRIYGGWFPTEEGSTKGWLVDYLWDQHLQKAIFAYRDPEGRIGKATHLDIKGIRYYPKVDANIQSGAVLFASDLGPEKSTRELLVWNDLYMRRAFLLDNPLDYKLCAYYAQFTWLYDCFDELAYLRAQGESDSGKSAIVLRMGEVCYRLTKSSGVGTAASFKHMQHMYRGTMFFDEIKDNLDEFDDRVVMLNIGAMKKQAWVPMMTSFKLPDGSVEFEVVNFYVYGPKLGTMYGKFPQDATESRFLTIKTIKHELSELREKNIPRRWSPEFEAQALYKRNMDMSWRLKNWRPHLQPPDSLEDLRVSTRVNQVTVPIKYILTMDQSDGAQKEAALNEINLVVQNLYEDQKFEKAQKTEARIIEAIDAVLYDPAYMLLNFVQDAELDEWGTVKYIRYSDLTKVVNYIMDEMNLGTGRSPLDVIKPGDEGQDEDGEQPQRRKGKKRFSPSGVTASTIGRKCRELRLPVHRLGRGYVAIIYSAAQPEVVQDRIDILKMRYGLEDLRKNGHKPAEPVVVDFAKAMSDDDDEASQEALL